MRNGKLLAEDSPARSGNGFSRNHSSLLLIGVISCIKLRESKEHRGCKALELEVKELGSNLRSYVAKELRSLVV
jgi:hypothetical protein